MMRNFYEKHQFRLEKFVPRLNFWFWPLFHNVMFIQSVSCEHHQVAPLPLLSL